MCESGPVHVIPRERLRNWQRWEPAELQPLQSAGDAAQAEPDEQALAEAARQAEARRAAEQAAELEALRRKAYDEAYAAGLAEGREAGHQEGYAAGKREGTAAGHAQGLAAGQNEIQAQAQALAALLDHCQAALAAIDDTVPDSLVRLALQVAERVVGSELQSRPEAIVSLVQQLLHHEAVGEGAVQLHLHPDDAALVAAQLGPTLSDHQWRLVNDAELQRGGCRLVSPLGELDATLAVRWERACAATGLEPPWQLS